MAVDIPTLVQRLDGELRAIGSAPFDRFARHADAMLDEREFFIRKAICWVLRETAKRRPEEVIAWLAHRPSERGDDARGGSLPARIVVNRAHCWLQGEAVRRVARRYVTLRGAALTVQCSPVATRLRSRSIASQTSTKRV